ncbi:transcriptional repressor [Candidatus Woesearchaeota archaeon]|nr:transcriptional repressor [Candidatus Woesearchaeota archaeon]
MISRNTTQKRILNDIINNKKTFFSAEDLLVDANKKDSKISIATVYRFLLEKEKTGELYSYLCDRKKTYSKNQASHCHFICENTGKIIHFNIDSLDFLKDKIPGTITSFQIEVRGICNNCSTRCKH